VTIEWREASAGGQTFRYVDSGDGPLVLLLHGLPDLPTGWDSIRARLNAAGFRTVAPYLRGYHPATLSERGFDTNDQADDVALLLDALGEATAVVLGHDWARRRRTARRPSTPSVSPRWSRSASRIR